MLPWLLTQLNDQKMWHDSSWYRAGKRMFDALLQLKLLNETGAAYEKAYSGSRDPKLVLAKVAKFGNGPKFAGKS